MSSKEIICQGEELFRLIPQRPPMVMIDRFYGIEENTSWSGLTVTTDNLFCRDGVLQETGSRSSVPTTTSRKPSAMTNGTWKT